MRIGKRFARFIAIIQFTLFVTHLVLYETWAYSSSRETYGTVAAALVFGLLSVSFVTASLLAFRYTNVAIRLFYKAAAVWVGLLTFLFPAAICSWTLFGFARLARLDLNFHRTVELLFGAALILGVYGVVNASWTRVTRRTIRLTNLPAAWRGRTVALVSDLHLGHVRNSRFLRRIIAMLSKENLHAVFIAGDLYDGTAIDARRAAEPLKQLVAPHGVYFVAGNHEQFGDDSKYLHAVAEAGVRVLSNEKIELDGLQVIGVPYRHATHAGHFASVLNAIHFDRDRASILLTHAPDHPEVAEASGVSLQLSGHTHLGQFIPWTWIARRMYGQFVYGLSRIGDMQVFTSSGAGTWGPPLRLGSHPEFVILKFE